MYLAKLAIKNFRSMSSCEINFQIGLNIIVGENNIGKSTVIDALRALLPSIDQQNPSLTDLDICSENPESPIEFAYIFDGLTKNEEAIFIEALVPYEQRFQAHFFVRLSPGKYGRKLLTKRWCGAHENQSLPSETLEELVSVYLPPLRNPTDGLKPGYISQIARLVKCFSSKNDEENLINLVKNVDEELKTQPPVSKASEAINQKIKDITGKELYRQIELSFSGTEFNKILGRLALFIEGMDVEQNGLGYNNVIFTAAVLGQLTHEHKATYRALLIEEPEAHLHPQLQVLLLQHLKKQATNTQSYENGRFNEQQSEPLPVQVIVTSHSPIFASQAPLDSIVSLCGKGKSFSIASLKNNPHKKKLERYLDSTRAELFFAKKIIMVEGIAEALLISLFAKRIGINLKEKSVSIVNVQGLNFDAFLSILSEGIEIPCAVITDSDPQKDFYPTATEIVTSSPTASALKDKETNLIKVFLSQKTFEYDLALYPDNLPTLTKAFKACHCQVGHKLEAELDTIEDSFEKTKMFFSYFNNSCRSKGEFAQELANLLEENINFTVPNYIINAIKYITDEHIKSFMGDKEC
ncbi:ATP-dependent endonuclease [Legionella dresdenensis]|uniref:ATP-dependent endonuclease n=1 Tax=Legionella dresdenensis TaxID=450200 RepID=A0ABV8CI46_9GAMM